MSGRCAHAPKETAGFKRVDRIGRRPGLKCLAAWKKHTVGSVITQVGAFGLDSDDRPGAVGKVNRPRSPGRESFWFGRRRVGSD